MSTLKIKQDIINSKFSPDFFFTIFHLMSFFQVLTIDRIYSLLEQCTDEQFLLCLLSLLRNMFNEKDTEILLPLFNSVKLLDV